MYKIVCMYKYTHTCFRVYKYIWLLFQVIWRYCSDSCPTASCVPITVFSELSYLKSLQFFQRLWLCRSYPYPNISSFSLHTVFFFVFCWAVFLIGLELVRRKQQRLFAVLFFTQSWDCVTVQTSPGEFSYASRFSELLCPTAKTFQWSTALVRVYWSMLWHWLCSLL